MPKPRPRPANASPSAAAEQDPAGLLAVRWVERRTLRPHPDNPRVIPAEAVAAVAESIRAFGWRQPIVVESDGRTIIAGHTRLRAAELLGCTHVPVVVASDLSAEQAAALRVIDNRAADFSTWDAGGLRAAIDAIPAGLDVALAPFDFEGLLASLGPAADPRAPEKGGGLTRGDAEATPDPRPDAAPDSQRGAVYELGPHRLGCGSATDPELRGRVLGGVTLDGLMMDPPYCSGGFKDAGKHKGSIGSKRKDAAGASIAPRIMGDALSSRGFSALLTATLDAWAAPWAFVFTDWRMWVHLYDLTEAAGLGVRSMIVWDKGHPGMGRGFRPQHELVMLAGRDGSLADFDPKASTGNVLACKRSGNPLHPTQKPAELLAMILGAASFMQRVGDPFGGSGSTLIACAQAGRVAYLTELDPIFCDVIRRRWTAFARDNGVDPGPGALV